MDARNIMKSIALGRSIIQAQVERLGSVIPEGPKPAPGGSISSGAFDLLAGTVAADMANAAAALQAVSEAEADARRAFRNTNTEESAVVIDGTATEVT